MKCRNSLTRFSAAFVDWVGSVGFGADATGDGCWSVGAVMVVGWVDIVTSNRSGLVPPRKSLRVGVV